MVWQICTSGRGVDVVEGVAGAGKTFARAAAREAWQAAGHPVIGCAVAAKAARQLQTDAGIPSQTIDRLLLDLDCPEAGGFAAGTVLVVDEAAMVGTRELARLLDHAAHARAKVVLVGDPCQLPEIEAGGAVVGLAARLGNVVLGGEPPPARCPWERAALAHLRAGETDPVIDEYLGRGRVTIASTGADARCRMVEAWMAARGDQTAVNARPVDSTTSSSSTSRRVLVVADAGVIGGDEIRARWPRLRNRRPRPRTSQRQATRRVERDQGGDRANRHRAPGDPLPHRRPPAAPAAVLLRIEPPPHPRLRHDDPQGAGREPTTDASCSPATSSPRSRPTPHCPGPGPAPTSTSCPSTPAETKHTCRNCRPDPTSCFGQPSGRSGAKQLALESEPTGGYAPEADEDLGADVGL